MRSIIIAAAGAAALFAASQAGAAVTTTNDAETHVVSFKGVNFNDPQAVDSFYARLRSTAREVCNSQSSYEARTTGRNCVDQIVSQAVAGLQRPLLTARHDAKSDVRFATGF
jgi:UrcA family protein